MVAVEHLTRTANQPQSPAETVSLEGEWKRESDAPISILVVEDEGIVARDLQESLTRLGYRVVGVAGDGAQAVSLVEQQEPDLVVMDVTLRGDLDGIQTARLIHERSQAPVVFLTGHSDPATLQRAVSAGPLGYILKPFQEVELRCAIEVAIHKHRADLAIQEREEALRRSAEHMQTLSLIDELTQLKNRRGFFELAEQAIKVAKREHHALGLFFMDLNGLKGVNDTHGHSVGDQALRDAAQVLRQTFRDSDIVARLGGDEFVALAHVAHDRDVDALRRRLRMHLDEFNAAEDRPFVLALSIGMTLVDVAADEEISDLIARADEAMYRDKRSGSR